MRRRQLDVKVGDFVLMEKHRLSSRRQKRVAKFGPKFVGSFKVLEMRNVNLDINVYGERITVNLDQVRVHRLKENGSEGSQLSSGVLENFWNKLVC